MGIKTESATNVAPRSATLNASFTGEGSQTEYFYEWGTNQGYGNSTPILTLPTPTGATQAPQALPGLELETLYHYRVVAINSIGTSKGDDMTFTTHPAVTALETKPVSSVDQDSITLNAQFQGDNLDTKYFFEYGLTTAYGTNTGELDAGTTAGLTPAAAEITQFNGFLTYHYRVVAKNSFGTTKGQDLTFVAPEAPKPGIENTEAVTVTPTTATVSTDVNPNHWQTIYLFEWGETHEYGTATPFSEPIGGPDNEPIQVSQELTGLVPGTIYFVRVVAANFRGTTEGEEISFVTPGVPRIDQTSSSAVAKTSAHLGGLVAAVASPTTVSFQYGTSGCLWSEHARGPDRGKPDLTPGGCRCHQSDAGNHLPLPDRRDQRGGRQLRTGPDLHDRRGTAERKVDGVLRQVEPPGEAAGRKGQAPAQQGEEGKGQTGQIPS